MTQIRRLPCQSGATTIAPLVNPVFLADIHLSWRKRKTAQAFLTFMRTEALRYEECFLLGDIFEFWIGDDCAWIAYPVLKVLKEYTQAGHKLYLMQGNRDVMMGETFAQSVGATLVNSGTVVQYRDKRLLISHGDEWCTLDNDYQEFRAMMRSEKFQKEALEMNPIARILWALKARKESKRQKKIKTKEMMDVVENDIRQLAKTHDCHYVIHGHTHRPGVHVMENVKRFVLSDWLFDDQTNPRYGWICMTGKDEPKLIERSRLFEGF